MFKKQIRYPSILFRTLVSCIDLFIVSVITSPLTYCLKKITFNKYFNFVGEQLPFEMIQNTPDLWKLFFLWCLYYTTIFASYFIGFWYYNNGVTPARYLTRMKIVDASDLSPITFKQCLIRFFLCLIMPINLISMLITDRVQGVHDKLANTVVIYK